MKEISLDKIRDKLSTTQYKLDYKNILNPQQYEAVCAKDGKFLLLAGAGTGKTHTITHRLARLVEDSTPPESILLLTFTKKAAMEMTQRANGILDERCSKIYSGTYHSFAANMLRKYGKHIGLSNNFTILDQSDAEDVINLVRAELELDKKERKFPKKGLLMELFSTSVNKNKSISHLVLENYPGLESDIPDILRCHEAYTKFKREKHVLDYDDMLVRLYELLTTNEVVAEKISSRFKYIMIDEYQDSNKLQNNIIKEVCKVHGNLMVVGDPNQSIYGFRGGCFENIMSFTEEFEDVKVIKLFQNYRSVQPILNLSNALMKQADQKHYNPLESNMKEGDKPSLVYVPNGYTQSMFIVQQILDLYEQGVPLRDICILTRNAYLTAELQLMLTQANLDFTLVGGRKILDAAHIKDIISFIKILVNPYDSVAWLRVLQLHEGIGPTTAKNILSLIDVAEGFKFKDCKQSKAIEKRKYYGSIASLLNNLNELIGKSFAFQFQKITEYYAPIMEDKFEDSTMRANDVDMFSVIAGRYKTAEQFLTDITLDPSEVKISEDDEEKDCLTISTIHSAKGLEWHTVFTVYTVDGIIPSSKSLDSIEDIQEELRLFYVAITRAKKNLYLCVPAEKFSFGHTERCQISRFLSNVPDLNKVVEKCKVR